MAFLFKKNMSSDEFVKFVKDSQQDRDITIELKNFEIKSFSFPFDELNNIHFIDTKWSDIKAEKRVFENVIFTNCEFNNIDFSEIVFRQVIFKNCILTNVVMNDGQLENVVFEKTKLINTNSNINYSYLRVIADEIRFKESELSNIDFYQSKARFFFENSKLNDVSGMGLASGSALYFINTDAFDIDFSRSTLTSLEVKNSTIKESKANNCTIDKIILEDSDIKFPIAEGHNYGTVTARNTRDIVILGTPVNDVNITGCGESNSISVSSMTFNTMTINECSPTKITFFDSKGKTLSITNAEVYDMDFRDAEIDRLILDNIHIRARLYYSGANIKKLETNNIRFDNDIKIKSEGANFEIKPDKIIPAD